MLDRRQAQPDAPAIGEQRRLAGHKLVRQVGEADDREFQPLRAVDRHQPDRAGPRGRRRSLGFADRTDAPGGERFGETAEVAAVACLELAGQPLELAHIGDSPLRRMQRAEVVVVAEPGDGARDDLAEAAVGGGTPRVRELCGEGGRAFVGRLTFELLPDRGFALPRPYCELDQHVRRAAAERRREHAVERQLVERVGQRPQVRDEVDDLRALEEPSTGGGERRVAEVGQRRLVGADRSARPEQHDDLLRPRRAGGDQLVDAPGQQTGFGAPPQRRGRELDAEQLFVRLPAVGVGDEQLDEWLRLSTRIVVAPGDQRHELLPESSAEDRVDGLQQRLA